jgi:hypothetical protein
VVTLVLREVEVEPIRIRGISTQSRFSPSTILGEDQVGN